MPRVMSWKAVAASFTTVSRLVERGQRVVINDLELSGPSKTAFRQAITHSFKEEQCGFQLDRIFKIDEKDPHKWIRIENTTNPKDEKIIDLIIKAMTYVRKHPLGAKKDVSLAAATVKKTPVRSVQIKKSVTATDFSVEQLCQALKSKGFVIHLEVR